MSECVTVASDGVAITAIDIVKRCLSAAPVSKTDAVRLFADVWSILSRMHQADAQDTKSGADDERQTAPAAAQDDGNWVPALNPRDSISADGNTIYCLVDGAPMKMLKRYIKRLGFTPDSYRQAFGLPGNYPMTAPGYAALKSEAAKRIGLGTPENKAGRKAGRKSRA